LTKKLPYSREEFKDPQEVDEETKTRNKKFGLSIFQISQWYN